LAENPLAGNPERLPLRLVGDGVTPRMQDDPAGPATQHGRASLEALAATLGASELDGQRFRSNIVIEGLPAWEEQGWIGRQIEIGGLAFRVAKPKARCLATHANPLTGERDLAVMPALLKAFAAERPTFAIALSSSGVGGTLRVGDRVKINGKTNEDQ
ncbi:MAG TPA: MOSC domain-containing protein, partial [Burkholderiales bacterium]|nr:MOSC domain-containing protein [Burkholderiales bacterium]